MSIFSFFKKTKPKDISNCSFVIFADKTTVEQGEDLTFTIGLCNRSSYDTEIGLVECFINYDSSQFDYKDFDDKIGGTKISFPSKRNAFWNARLTRLGSGHTLPANSTYVMGVMKLSTAELEKKGDYKISLSNCCICLYEGLALDVPLESNKLIFKVL